MLPGSELDELDELAPAEAAEELLERMLAYARYRGAGGSSPRVARPSGAVPLRAAAAGAAARDVERPSRSTTRPCSARRSAGCCALRRRST